MNLRCGRLLRLIFLLTIGGPVLFAARSEAEKVIASSHIATVTVKEKLRGDEEGQRFKAMLHFPWTKGSFPSQTVEVVVRDYEWNKKPPLTFEKGGVYMVFCREIVTENGNVYYAENDETLSFGTTPDKAAIDRIARLSGDQVATIRKKFQNDAVRNSPFAEKIDRALALLFDSTRQQEAITQLLALPKEADAELIWRIYDAREIPSSLMVFKPNAQGMTFHVDPIDRCARVQEVVLGVLRQRILEPGPTYGWIQENDSTASRNAVVDTWFYAVACSQDLQKK